LRSFLRFPQLDLVSLRVDEPPKAAIILFLDLAHDLGAALRDLGEGPIEIIDHQIEHEVPG